MSRRSRRRLFAWSAMLLVIVAAAIVALPEVARRLATSRLEEALTVPVRIDDVDINLFRGNATVENLIIGTEPRPILTVPFASVEFSRRALLTGDVDLRSVLIDNPSF